MPEAEAPQEFFVSRIMQEAATEGRPLTNTELQFLRAGIEDSKEIQRVNEAFDKEVDHEHFAARVKTLLERALAREMAADVNAAVKYRQALRKLEEREAGSQLWFMAVPAVEPASLRRGFVLGWIVVLVGVVLGLFLFYWRSGR